MLGTLGTSLEVITVRRAHVWMKEGYIKLASRRVNFKSICHNSCGPAVSRYFVFHPWIRSYWKTCIVIRKKDAEKKEKARTQLDLV